MVEPVSDTHGHARPPAPAGMLSAGYVLLQPWLETGKISTFQIDVLCFLFLCIRYAKYHFLLFWTLLAIGFVGYVSEFTAMYIWDQCFMFGGRASDWRKVLPVVCVTLLKVFVNLSLAQLFPPML